LPPGTGGATSSLMVHGHRILIVEDNPQVQDALGRLLQSEGYFVEFAGDGGEALDRLERAEPPCLILLDLMMPRVDGWQFRSAQVQNPKMAAIPVVVCSGVWNAGEKATSLGIPHYLTKPIDPDALLNLVRDCCDRAECGPSDALH
jgi:CheY-like chemotaxis protein